ncbi:uncharacterized protein J3D65DRAFT_638643 [Phyllosticta citribraziliensis]|uniref:Hyaluronan/mRNA-binding protein domain-containing protein n=1 Tax=Phyllosticta citribraziliensis TaxID=989973 RepID=A0ABR1LCZ1_9PEZI
MSGSIASKNVYELLGNDPEQDSDREPEPPTKAIEKTLPRSGKRSGPEPTKEPRTAGANTRKEVGGNEGAFRDRNAGRDSNRSKPADDGVRSDRHPRHEDGGRGRGRGGRGGRGPRGAPRDDRHSKTGISDHPKQAEKGWGGDDGNKELADEIAGETIAKEEEGADIDAEASAAAAAQAAEDKVKSYDEYLADLLEKKAQLNAGVAIRKPNEGAGKKFPEGKTVERVEEEYFAGENKEKNRERSKKEKNQIDLGDIYGRGEERSGGFRGGRGGRGGRGRGEGSFRGEGRGRGGPRGGAPRGAPRGGAVNINDSSAFPSLGA